MAKKTKRKLSKATWAIRIEADGRHKAGYLYHDGEVMLFRTRAKAKAELVCNSGWVRELGHPVRVDVAER